MLEVESPPRELGVSREDTAVRLCTGGMGSNLTLRERGATAVETSICIAVFTGLLFLACEFSLVLLRAATAQYVIAREARESLAFNQLRNSTADQIISRIRQRASALGADASTWEITICPASRPDCTTSDLGSANDLLLIQADPNLRIAGRMLPLGYIASVLISREATG